MENALKHGDLDFNPDVFLNILIRNEPDCLLFQVKNSFDPQNEQKDEQGGVGLDNIQKRLELQYRGRHFYETRIEGQSFCAYLKLMD